MNYTEFIQDISTEIQTRLGDEFNVTMHKVEKTNGIIYDGMTIKNQQFNIAPTFYLNQYYHRYLDGVKLEDIYDDIIRTYNTKKPTKDYDINSFVNFEKAKSQIIFRLINKEKNINLLKSVPHIDFHDMAIVFLYSVDEFKDTVATILISNEHMTIWGTNIEELHLLAIENSPRILGIKFTNINDIVSNITNFPFELSNADIEIPMYVLSNNTNTNGASAILYKGLLKEIADKLDGNLLIIPSSVDEVILIPIVECDDYTMIKSYYSQMVCEVNETTVSDPNILSSSAYIYDRKSDSIS